MRKSIVILAVALACEMMASSGCTTTTTKRVVPVFNKPAVVPPVNATSMGRGTSAVGGSAMSMSGSSTVGTTPSSPSATLLPAAVSLPKLVRWIPSDPNCPVPALPKSQMFVIQERNFELTKPNGDEVVLVFLKGMYLDENISVRMEIAMSAVTAFNKARTLYALPANVKFGGTMELDGKRYPLWEISKVVD